MEREELIKAIKCCMNDDMEPQCNDCPAVIDGFDCSFDYGSDSIDLPTALVKEAVRELKNSDNDESYWKGACAAWDLAQKILKPVEDDGYTSTELYEIFGINERASVLVTSLSAKDALTKVEEYEKKRKLKVGDEVTDIEGRRAVVFKMYEGNFALVIYADGDVDSFDCRDLKKTGRYFDGVEQLIKKMSEEAL